MNKIIPFLIILLLYGCSNIPYIKGVVLENGKPVSNVNIKIPNNDCSGKGIVDTTDSKGKFEFGNYEDKEKPSCKLCIQRDGYWKEVWVYKGYPLPWYCLKCSLANNYESICETEWCYTSLMGDYGFSVKGRIVDDNGKPVEGCTLNLMSESNNETLKSLSVDSDFHESFLVMPKKEKYVLAISKPCYSSFETTYEYPEMPSLFEIGLITLKKVCE